IIDKVNGNSKQVAITEADRLIMREGKSLITSKERENRLEQKPTTLWIASNDREATNEAAYTLERRLFDYGKTAIVLPAQKATEHVAHMCNLLNEQGFIVICTTDALSEKDAHDIKNVLGENRFTWVTVNEACAHADFAIQTGNIMSGVEAIANTL
ncbi:MAG: hypothetical protein ACRCT5_02090, partial [Tannerellaceae bacterium]